MATLAAAARRAARRNHRHRTMSFNMERRHGALFVRHSADRLTHPGKCPLGGRNCHKQEAARVCFADRVSHHTARTQRIRALDSRPCQGGAAGQVARVAPAGRARMAEPRALVHVEHARAHTDNRQRRDAALGGGARPDRRHGVGCPAGTAHRPPRRVDGDRGLRRPPRKRDRKSTRLNSSHGYISYAVFCLKKKTKKKKDLYIKKKKKKKKNIYL